jgi:hypothetical protein
MLAQGGEAELARLSPPRGWCLDSTPPRSGAGALMGGGPSHHWTTSPTSLGSRALQRGECVDRIPVDVAPNEVPALGVAERVHLNCHASGSATSQLDPRIRVAAKALHAAPVVIALPGTSQERRTAIARYDHRTHNRIPARTGDGSKTDGQATCRDVRPPSPCHSCLPCIDDLWITARR